MAEVTESKITRIWMSGWPYERVADWMRQRDLASPHARAWFAQMHRQHSFDPGTIESQGPTLSPRLRAELESLEAGDDLTVTRVDRSVDGTVKLVLTSPAGDSFESVVIPQGERRTLCVSSQVGCAVGCPFCFTGTMGIRRDLEAWEIVAQHRLASEHSDIPITNIVFMGMGEPLHNEEAVADACAVLGSDQGTGIPRSRIVVSTSGVGPRIRPFWERGTAVLALSLHAANDELRDRLVPLNRKWNLAALKGILSEIPFGPRETVTVEYVLIGGVNDSLDDARDLAAWCEGIPIKINLIELNPFPGGPYERSSRESMLAFGDALRAAGAFATLRFSRGDDIMAACGQLALAEDLRKP